MAPLKVNDVVINDTLVKAHTLNEYFTSVFTPITKETPPELHVQSALDINPIIVDTNGASELLQSLDIHKACGIPAHLLKETREIISPSLAFIFQASLQQCSLPLDWKRANIVPLFKKGDHSLPSNYRPVSLTCICSKLLEHIMYSHIYSHFAKYDLLCDQQHGFRQGRSCETQLLLTINDFSKSLNNNDQTDVVLLDFSKAFDKVSHQHLFHKLHHYGI